MKHAVHKDRGNFMFCPKHFGFGRKYVDEKGSVCRVIFFWCRRLCDSMICLKKKLGKMLV